MKLFNECSGLIIHTYISRSFNHKIEEKFLGKSKSYEARRN